MIYIGIDPGMSGAVAYKGTGDTAEGLIFGCHKFADKTERDIADLFSDIAKLNAEKYAMIENVHSFPHQGVSSIFKFGRNYGLLLGLLYANRIPFELVTPQKWQKEIGCLSHGDKNITKTKAQQLFPELKITHAIADALLICEFARKTRP